MRHFSANSISRITHIPIDISHRCSVKDLLTLLTHPRKCNPPTFRSQRHAPTGYRRERQLLVISLSDPILFRSSRSSDSYDHALRRDGGARATCRRIIGLSRCELWAETEGYVDTCPAPTYSRHFSHSPWYWSMQTLSEGRPLLGRLEAEHESHVVNIGT